MRYIFLTLFLFLLSCSITKQVKNGNDAYELKQYAKAIGFLTAEYEASSNREIQADKAFKLGRSYERTNDNANALQWYEKASKLDYGLSAYKSLAFAYKEAQMYDRAVKAFQLWSTEGGDRQEASREIAICNQAKAWINESHEVEIQSLYGNSAFSDYAPVLYDNDFLVFASDRNEATGGDTYEWTGKSFSDLFIMSKNGSQAQLFDDQINTSNNEGVACFNQDFSEMFFTRCYDKLGDDYCKILWTVREGNGWSEPVEPFYMDPDANYGHPTLIEQDSVMIFSSNTSLDGSDQYDLYYAVRDEEGWSEPDLMPESINTKGNEQFPRSDGDTLYFSSDYLPGLGGLDIFKTFLKDGEEWARPQNLKAPINSSADDFSFLVDYSQNEQNARIIGQGYFSSSRSGSGNDDIFKYTIRKKEITESETEPIVEEEPEETIEKKIFIALRVITTDREDQEDPDSKILGKTPVTNAEVTIVKRNDRNQDQTGKNGRLFIDGEAATDYEFIVKKDGYLSGRKTLSIKALELLDESNTFNVEVDLEKIYFNKEIVMEDIYYDLDKWFIRDDAKPSLNSLTDLLSENENIKIRLAAHTDCRGEDEYNLELSQKRAQSAVDYLISTGISADRLQAQGFGESKLAVNCICGLCNEEQHQQNRRTTFTILEL